MKVFNSVYNSYLHEHMKFEINVFISNTHNMSKTFLYGPISDPCIDYKILKYELPFILYIPFKKEKAT